jgi:hypothetical protein
VPGGESHRVHFRFAEKTDDGFEPANKRLDALALVLHRDVY